MLIPSVNLEVTTDKNGKDQFQFRWSEKALSR